ncbi:hypothetical protein SAMN05444392_1168 [Seinonella peptonophila]|uniref:Uncharacterized protein n=1 Tax=Seinonella peptonophila TaxID=112248 RepID=A0A1M5AUD8_9BACL|nr:hypothetical protein [Seinonella peptonophila]SHF33843.1 hypothetical protein SAMN05444392_1168 [Seinonella peptonophila]
MSSKKRKFKINLQPFNGPIHLQGLAMWGSDETPYCHVCKKNDKVIWDEGEYKCSRCHVVVER